ncbi:hypothetical protein BT96DRAFT_1015553 [Gymnopus androsaceus JB14]|uniref:Uncharacterized protein n=1 Tax=Gymnopus androsaceus JB14 TaxID=1447944 RepID=A0A6A4I9Y1_9AGAR|nr:hypothetical protein BT96DRAFT_1015553 [Gymnopus androsaceus JB14]
MPDLTNGHSAVDQWQTLSTLPATDLRAILMQEQTHMCALRDQMSSTQHKIDMIKTMLSPFTRLPQELVSEIFQFYCGAQGAVYDEFQQRKSRTRPSKVDPDRIVSGIDTIPPQLILASVCQFWRSVAHETHSLWKDLTVYIQSGKFSSHNDLIEEWITHSGEVLPLDIRIVVPKGKGQATRSILDSILPFSNRWRRLELFAPLQTLLPLLSDALDVPLLEHVSMDICHITESSMQTYEWNPFYTMHKRFPTFMVAPKLHSFKCGISFDTNQEFIFDLSLDFLSIIPPYEQVTELSVEGDAYFPDNRGGLRFVSLFQNLISCSIKVYPGACYSEIPIPLTLPKLCTLSVTVEDPNDAVHFFRQLTLPELKALKLRIDREVNFGTDTFGELLRMQARSSCVLEELSLHDSTTGANLFEFLQTLTSLRSLTVYESHSFRIQDLIPWLANQPPLHRRVQCDNGLPNLKELHLLTGSVLKNGNGEPLTGLADIVYERCNHVEDETSPRQKLEILEVQTTLVAFDNMEQDEYDALGLFMQQGLKVRLNQWMPNGSLCYIGDDL